MLMSNVENLEDLFSVSFIVCLTVVVIEMDLKSLKVTTRLVGQVGQTRTISEK